MITDRTGLHSVLLPLLMELRMLVYGCALIHSILTGVVGGYQGGCGVVGLVVVLFLEGEGGGGNV